MSDEMALMAAILAAPEDDAPRLVLADWLDDHSEPERAEFIRVQCELAERLKNGTDPACRYPAGAHASTAGAGACIGCYPVLRRRERELFAAGVSAYFLRQVNQFLDCVIQTDHYPQGCTPCVILRRGFIDELRCDAETLINGGMCHWSATLDASHEECPVCKGDQRAPAASGLLQVQPVQVVRLTTWPAVTHTNKFNGNSDGYVIRANSVELVNPYDTTHALRRRWPTVKTWHLPATAADS